ncbi:MAG: hypothetical protein DMG38_23520 [Acidobacteria bacterium]|nr:MAG: hypothetical protein DMG38_23520 [Acidobacteriota bacterium]
MAKESSTRGPAGRAGCTNSEARECLFPWKRSLAASHKLKRKRLASLDTPKRFPRKAKTTPGGGAHLRRCGRCAAYQVLTASNPLEAIRLADNHHAPLHLLLTDVVMPDLNGRELAKQLLAKRPEMKLLNMSGYTNGVLSEHDFRAEEVAFIEKPFSREALSRKVRRALNAGASF